MKMRKNNFLFLIFIILSVLCITLMFNSCTSLSNGYENDITNENSVLNDKSKNFDFKNDLGEETQLSISTKKLYSYDTSETVNVISSIKAQVDEEISLPKAESKGIIECLNSLNLVEVADPYADPLTAPIGGDVILKIGDDDDKIYIVGDDVIKYGTKYYKDSDNKIKELAKTVTDLIYAYDQGR
mgnify:CR=1 FL=1